MKKFELTFDSHDFVISDTRLDNKMVYGKYYQRTNEVSVWVKPDLHAAISDKANDLFPYKTQLTDVEQGEDFEIMRQEHDKKVMPDVWFIYAGANY